MGIIYLLLTIDLYIGFLMYKKTDKEENILFWGTISVVILMCFTSLICLLFHYLHIPITLSTMSITNLLASGYFYYDIYINNKRQKYILDKKDLLSLIIIIGIGILVFFTFFTKDFIIQYDSPDPAAHFQASRLFSLGDSLTAKVEGVKGANYGNMQFLGYTNVGMFFKVLPFSNSLELYKTFVIYNIFLFVLAGYLFYFLISKKINNVFHYVLAMFVTTMYMLGYPLTNLLYGFFYWGLGITVINTIIHLIDIYVLDKVNKNILRVSLLLTFFGLFCSYYLFVPLVYFVTFVYFIINFYKKDKLKTKEFLWLIICSLVIPSILGFSYFILPMFKGADGIMKITTIEGVMYKNLFSDYIILFPIAIMGVISDFKNKNKFNFAKWLFFGIIIMIIYMYIYVLSELCSTYYFYKSYYLLWLLTLYFGYKGLVYLNKKISLSYLIIYVVLALSLFNNSFISKPGNYLLKIYVENFQNVTRTFHLMFNEEELEGIKYVILNKDKLVNSNNEIPAIGSYYQLRWIEALTDAIPRHKYNSSLLEYKNKFSFEEWAADDDTNTLIYLKTSRLVEKKTIKFNGGNPAFENSSILIFQKK